MLKTRAIASWISDNLLLILAYFLIAFIPLYPKLPLFDIIPGYIVRVRVEDFVVLLAAFVWLVQFLRGKIVWRTPITWAIAAYAVVGILSTISAVVLTKTVPAEFLHIGKTVLHYFRYLEYFSLFFIVAASITSIRQLKSVFALISLTVVALAIYGFGQRYWYWPVYSTMNREFSKGITLYLSEHARVQSTFGGHYDLAAYLVVILPLILAGLLFFKQKLVKFLLSLVYFGGVWLLIQTASRSSSLGFAVGSYIVIGFYALSESTLLRRILSFIRFSFLHTVVMLFLILRFGDDIYERFLQTLKAYPKVNDEYHALNKQRKELFDGGEGYILDKVLPESFKSRWLSMKKPKPPKNGLSTEQASVMVSSDEQPSPDKPSDVYVNVPITKLVATQSATGEITIQEINTPRDYSAEAKKSGLSAAIRYDTLWPRAIAGFKKNPLLGSGYATLTKESAIQFTEAESTDNNFLRTLGETGLLGFITFYGAITTMLYVAFRLIAKSKDNVYATVFASGFIAASIGLLINAIYIDVFAASKVAFTFWAFAGVVAAAYMKSSDSIPVLQGITTKNLAHIFDTTQRQAATPKRKKKHTAP